MMFDNIWGGGGSSACPLNFSQSEPYLKCLNFAFEIIIPIFPSVLGLVIIDGGGGGGGGGSVQV